MARVMLRRWLAGLNWGVTLVALAILFIFVNFIASRRYVRHDLSQVRITQLSDKTTQLVRQLSAPVRIIVLFQPAQRLYELLRDLLKSYEDRNPRITVEYIDPEQDRARVLQLSKEFQLERANVIIVASGARKKFLSEADLAEYDYSNQMGFGGQPSLKAFKGEEAVTSALINVTQTTQSHIWVTTGHGEKSLENASDDGLADLKRHLERENSTVTAASLLEQPGVPADVNLIIIPDPTRRFVEQELLALESYLQRGGRLLALIDPLTNTGLDGLLSKWGANLGNDIVVDPARQLPFVSPANVLVTTYTQHPIVERMETLMTLFPLSRSVQPSVRPGLKTSILAMTSPQGWGETTTGSEVFKFDKGQDAKGPVSIAVAVERTSPPATRLVVIGDSDFLANSQLGNVGNLDFASGAVQWLLNEEQLIGIGPKPLESIKLHLSAGALQGLWLLNVLALPALFVGLGIAMWWVRRQ